MATKREAVLIMSFHTCYDFLYMEPNIETQLQELRERVDAIYVSVEKTRKYFLVVMWVTIALVVLPVLGLLFAIPAFINSYMTSFEGLL